MLKRYLALDVIVSRDPQEIRARLHPFAPRVLHRRHPPVVEIGHQIEPGVEVRHLGGGVSGHRRSELERRAAVYQRCQLLGEELRGQA